MATEHTEHVLVRYEKLRNISMKHHEVKNENLHEHGVLELGLLLSGSAELYCTQGHKHIPTNGLYLVNPYEPHRLYSVESAKILSVWISPNFVREYFAGVGNMTFLQHTVTGQMPGHDQLQTLLQLAADSYFRDVPGSNLECVGALTNLLAVLLRSVSYTLNTDAQKQLRKKRTGRMQRIAAYMDQHYKERLTLTQLAEVEGLTPAYMSRVFTTLFGMSFQEYLNQLRLEQAIPLVRDSSIYLLDVCMECGFSDTRYLNAVFQKTFGMSATEYRNTCRNQNETI